MRKQVGAGIDVAHEVPHVFAIVVCGELCVCGCFVHECQLEFCLNVNLLQLSFVRRVPPGVHEAC